MVPECMLPRPLVVQRDRYFLGHRRAEEVFAIGEIDLRQLTDVRAHVDEVIEWR